MEDLTTSVDYQDIFSKITCKVGSLNVRHFEESVNNLWAPGCYKGILFTSSDTLTKSLDSPVVTPRSESISKTRSLLRKSEHKFTDSKQRHSFLSLIWTRAKGSSVSKRLEVKDVSWEPSTRQRQFVNELIVSMQPVDVVVWCPGLQKC
ncbi:putative vacuolar protein sorting-associated protein 13B [Apostichopus japonicus]|uniref:Putative vacuolar protein sorting-associated protein 13B n=1 Tax=Stichopus japonicus TaxID=307972 RepID=A0A2G8K7E0_STIJA|nr:putative vacuolar protein sorting-associated protein 13B [Apostichopus japonicus]